MNFSIGYVAPAIILPLRYYFSTASTVGANLVWNEDPTKRTIEIGESFEFTGPSLQEKPRIIVSRGSFGVSKTGLAENMSETLDISANHGLATTINYLMYSGAATVTIEARQKGTCELVADMVTHFILWTKPILCSTQGWKEFGFPLSVSDCNSTSEEGPGITKFQVYIQVPWMKEESWRVSNDGPTLRNILLGVTNASILP